MVKDLGHVERVNGKPRLVILDADSRDIRPGDGIYHAGRLRRVCALWIDRDTGTNVSLHRETGAWDEPVRVYGRDCRKV